jgi:hypothetical protein
MPDKAEELKSIAVEINRLLSRYIEINDAIFKLSWRKIIPLPFVFKPIGFAHLHNCTRDILSQLEVCNQRSCTLAEDLTENESLVANFLSEYCTALTETISLLKGIIHQLSLKGEGSEEYSLIEHHRQCDLYKNAVDKYTAMGDRLNELCQRIA